MISENTNLASNLLFQYAKWSLYVEIERFFDHEVRKLKNFGMFTPRNDNISLLRDPSTPKILNRRPKISLCAHSDETCCIGLPPEIPGTANVDTHYTTWSCVRTLQDHMDTVIALTTCSDSVVSG